MPFDNTEEQLAVSEEQECPIEGWGLRSCTFQPFLPFAYYMMWLTFGTEQGTVKSQPVYAMPMDLGQSENQIYNVPLICLNHNGDSSKLRVCGQTLLD